MSQKLSAASTITQAQQAPQEVAQTSVEFDKDFVSKMENSPYVSEVSVDAMVLLKMMNHCTEKVPIQVTGQLLGLDNGGVLEITNCFPFPSSLSDSMFLKFIFMIDYFIITTYFIIIIPLLLNNISTTTTKIDLTEEEIKIASQEIDDDDQSDETQLLTKPTKTSDISYPVDELILEDEQFGANGEIDVEDVTIDPIDELKMKFNL